MGETGLAENTVDGKFVGSAPSALLLPPGEHLIWVQKARYTRCARKVTLTASSVVTLDARLEKR
jgi:hypothetical protein